MVNKTARKGIFKRGEPICNDEWVYEKHTYICTRKHGHKGKHRSGIGNDEYNHEW